MDRTRWRYQMGTNGKERMPVNAICFMGMGAALLVFFVVVAVRTWLERAQTGAVETILAFLVLFIIGAVVVQVHLHLIDYYTTRYYLDAEGIHLLHLNKRERFVPWDSVTKIDLCLIRDERPPMQAIRCTLAPTRLPYVQSTPGYFQVQRSRTGEETLGLFYCVKERDHVLLFYQTTERLREFRTFAQAPGSAMLCARLPGDGMETDKVEEIEPTEIRHPRRLGGEMAIHIGFSVMVLWLLLWGKNELLYEKNMSFAVWVVLVCVLCAFILVDLGVNIYQRRLKRKWRIVVSSKQLAYTNWLGRTKIFPTEAICWQLEGNGIALYENGRRLVSVDLDWENAEVLLKLKCGISES